MVPLSMHAALHDPVDKICTQDLVVKARPES